MPGEKSFFFKWSLINGLLRDFFYKIPFLVLLHLLKSLEIYSLMNVLIELVILELFIRPFSQLVELVVLIVLLSQFKSLLLEFLKEFLRLCLYWSLSKRFDLHLIIFFQVPLIIGRSLSISSGRLFPFNFVLNNRFFFLVIFLRRW